MDHFNYRNGILHAEDVPLPAIAEAVGTPAYVYSTATLTRHFRVFEDALAGLDHLICYAVKANSNLAVLRLMGSLGAGMDVVSEGEYRRARAAGIPGERIVFSGVGKTRDEMRLALTGGIRQFNVESEPELLALSEVATSLSRRAPIALRVNPDVDAKTHAKIATGKSENKFGVPVARAREVYAEAAAQDHPRQRVATPVRPSVRSHPLGCPDCTPSPSQGISPIQAGMLSRFSISSKLGRARTTSK